jgi:hypothetical protein
MTYYCDEQKAFVRSLDFIGRNVSDKQAHQSIGVSHLICGKLIRPEKQWSPCCKKLFLKEQANSLRLGGAWCPWDADLSFLRGLPECKSLTIGFQKPVNLSVLAGNPNIESLQLDYVGSVEPGEFDLTSLPNLKQCQVTMHRNFMSVLKCPQLISLGLFNGKYDGILDLESLPNLEEFICANVGKVRGVVFNSKVRLRALNLSRLKLFETIQPIHSVTEDLRVVTLDKTPKLNIEWLAHANNAECIALRVGAIPSLAFLKGLKKLQVLDLFGSKVLDRDLSFRDSLKNKLDPKLWSEK